jgi:structural maintenance of chromosome 2
MLILFWLSVCGNRWGSIAGMFNNANVLFKTDFVDGISVVKRYTQLQPIDEDDRTAKENTSGKATTAKKASSTKSTARQLAL